MTICGTAPSHHALGSTNTARGGIITSVLEAVFFLLEMQKPHTQRNPRGLGRQRATEASPGAIPVVILVVIPAVHLSPSGTEGSRQDIQREFMNRK